MVILLTQIDKTTVMQGKSDDFKSSGWFNNPDIAFAPTNNNGKVTLVTKPKFEGKLFSTLQSNKPNPNNLDEWFGWENDWSPDGQILAVGAPRYETNTTTEINSGSVYLYKLEELAKPSPSPFNILQRADVLALFGASIRWSPDGTKLAVGANANFNSNTNNKQGSVFIYNLTDIMGGSNPSRSVKISPTSLSPNANFGISVNWNFDGSQIAIGAANNQNQIGSVHVYNTTDLTNPVNIIIPPGRTQFSDTCFGYKAEWDSANKYLAIGAYLYDKGSNRPEDNSGAIYIYSVETLKTTSNPAPVHTLVAQTNGEALGWDVKWSPNGKYLAAGAPYAHKLYIYNTDDFKSTNPLPTILSVANTNKFGISVDWNKTSTRLAVGSVFDDNGNDSRGSVYIFDTNKIESPMEPIQQIVLTGKIILSTRVEGLGRGLRWHPSGRFLAINAYLNNNYTGTVFILK